MDIKLITWESVGWMDFFQDRDKLQAFMNTVNEHSGSIKCGEFLDFPRKYQPFKEGCAMLC